MPDATAFGAVRGTVHAPIVDYFAQPVPVEIVAKHLGDTPAHEALRIAASCEALSCIHFEADHCTLGDRVNALLGPVVDRLPPCAIRSTCRWFAEQGGGICLRCPQISTVVHPAVADPIVIEVASPAGARGA